MNNRKATKRALLTSVMALVMCVVMLVGTTFAWFTDTASTSVNKIQAGTLKVDIVDKDGQTLVGAGKSLKFTNKNGSEDILWEPGATFLTQEFKIKNDGTLALKWKMSVNGGVTKNGSKVSDFNLLDVIAFSVVTKDSEGNFTTTDIDSFVGHLNKEETSGEYYLQGTMDTSAGNDYKGLSLEGVTVTVCAAQDTVEYDSFEKEYDKDAAWDGTYPTTRPTTFEVDETTHTIYLNSAEAFFYLNTLYAGSSDSTVFPDSKYWGYDIVLNVDIDMMNMPFEPILLGNTWMVATFYDTCDATGDTYYGKTWGERQRGLNHITAYGEFSKFNGNGHTIRNINLTSDGKEVGLFAEVNNICNLNLENVYLKATNDKAMVGALAASHANNITDREAAKASIENVHVKNVTIEGNGKYAGGLIGYSGHDVLNCSAENGQVTGSKSVGALIGFVDAVTAEIKSCSVKDVQLANTAADETVRARVGYIAGRTNMVNSTLTVTGFTHDNIMAGGTAVTAAFGNNAGTAPTIN